MFCMKCGSPMREGSVFCEVCGNQQTFQPQQPAPQQPAAAQNAYPRNAYPQAVTSQPVYQQPVYQQPAPQQPVYSQPMYQQSGYPQTGYPQTGYPQTGYPQPPRQPVPRRSGHGAGTAGKAAKGGKGILGWILAGAALVTVVILVVVILNATNAFKSDEDLIRERIEALETAYNNTDWDGVMDCMDESTRAMMDMVMGFADGLLSDSIGFDIAMSDMFAMSGLALDGDYCQIEVLDIQINGDTAMVTVRMSMEMYGYSDAQEAALPMVKEGGDWYISIEGGMGFLGY